MMFCELLDRLGEISKEVGHETEVFAQESGDPDRGLAFDILSVEIEDDKIKVILL